MKIYDLGGEQISAPLAQTKKKTTQWVTKTEHEYRKKKGKRLWGLYFLVAKRRGGSGYIRPCKGRGVYTKTTVNQKGEGVKTGET